MTLEDQTTYCGELVRANDPDRFFLSLTAAAHLRPALWSLFAFNHEVAKTREVVSDATLGQIRLQWWREAVAMIYEGRAIERQNEVVQSLAHVVQRYALPRPMVEAVIKAREFDLQDKLPASAEDLLNYANNTVTPLNTLVLSVLSEEAAPALVQSVSSGYGLTGLLRATVYLARQRRCVMPMALLDAEGAREDDFYTLRPHESINRVIRNLAAQARDLVKVSGVKSGFLKKSARMSELYLHRIAAAQYNPYNPLFLSLPPFFHLRVALR